MAIVVYIRKEYFRGITLKDKSAHILEFHYKGKQIEVFENNVLVFFCEYLLENTYKAQLTEFYIPNITLRSLGYGSVCMQEILDQLKKKRVSVVRAPLGYTLAPVGYTGPEQYKELMKAFYEKNGFAISGDENAAIQILK